MVPPSLEDRLTATADMTLDVQGLACPLPVLKARKALAGMTAGAVLEVLTTEPQSVADFEAFCGVSGHVMLTHNLNGGTYRFLIRKGG
jgi:tRNA 2-thiouridine synthesizing protein A